MYMLHKYDNVHEKQWEVWLLDLIVELNYDILFWCTLAAWHVKGNVF